MATPSAPTAHPQGSADQPPPLVAPRPVLASASSPCLARTQSDSSLARLPSTSPPVPPLARTPSPAPSSASSSRLAVPVSHGRQRSPSQLLHQLQLRQHQQAHAQAHEQNQIPATNFTGAPDAASIHGSIASAQASIRTGRSRSQLSSRAVSLQNVAATASALYHNPDARRIRTTLFREMVSGWFHLSVSSKALLLYYIGATIVEIIITLTVVIIEREKAKHCFYLIVFLGLYLLRAIAICWSLLRRFLYERPDDLPQDLSGACGALYKTLINWASFILLLLSIILLTTQSNCADTAPGLFYLVLVFSLLGYICLAALLVLWFVILFCLNGLVTLLELFGFGPTVMQWQGATEDMLDEIPIIKYSRPLQPPLSTLQMTPGANLGAGVGHGPGTDSKASHIEVMISPEAQEIEKTEGPATTPSIVITQDPIGSLEAHGRSVGRDPVVIEIESCQKENVPSTNPSSTDLDTTATAGRTDPSSQPPHPMNDPESVEEKEKTSCSAVEPGSASDEALQEDGPGVSANGVLTNSCSICLCDYEDLEELRHLYCDHIFHKECVDEWLKLKRTCPLCKMDISEAYRARRSWFRRNSHPTRRGRSSMSLGRRSTSAGRGARQASSSSTVPPSTTSGGRSFMFWRR